MPVTDTEDPVNSISTPTSSTQGNASSTKPKWLRIELSPRVFIPSAVILISFVSLALLVPTRFKAFISMANESVINYLGWYYVLISIGFVLFALYVAFSEFGNIRLGDDDDEPTFPLFTWFSMLFAAGMGIGLVFWGVAEPLSHFINPPPGSNPTTVSEAANGAMATTFLHWGLHAWAIYIVIGLAVGYSHHRKGRPISMRWMLEPLLGDRVKGWMGDVIDITAIVGTLFGVAASLGFGVTQFSAGLEFLGIIEPSIGYTLLFVLGITILATISVVSGLDLGIKILSNTNLILALFLMLFVLVAGEPLFVLREFVNSIGGYVGNFIQLSFRTMPFQGEAGEGWIGGWTTYYWGWWMAWSPFVGVFIARISRGRTVREFVLGVLFVPANLTFLWFSILGGTALWQQINGYELVADGSINSSQVLFEMLQHLPGGPILSGLFLILIVVFFVTSSDSASFVVDMLSTGGNPNPPVLTRIFWATMEGSIAAALLYVGSLQGNMTDGLGALQTTTILVAAPFSIVMVLTVVSTLRAFNKEHNDRIKAENKLLAREMKRTVETQVNSQVDTLVEDKVAEFLEDHLESSVDSIMEDYVNNLPEGTTIVTPEHDK